MSDFVSRHKPEWEELEQLVTRARKRISRMTPAELSRLDVLYRRTTVHLAQVSTRTRDEGLTKYLNDLTAAAHSIIYLPPRRSVFVGLGRFLAEGFARSVARAWPYHLAAGLLMIAGAVAAYLAASSDTAAAYALTMPGDARLPGSTPEQLHEFLTHGRDQGSGEKFVFASYLFSHNLGRHHGLGARRFGRDSHDLPDVLQRHAARRLYGHPPRRRHLCGLLGVDPAAWGDGAARNRPVWRSRSDVGACRSESGQAHQNGKPDPGR